MKQTCDVCGDALVYYRGTRGGERKELQCDVAGCGQPIGPRASRFSCAKCDFDVCGVCGVSAENAGVAGYRTRGGWASWEGEHGHVTPSGVSPAPPAT